MTIRSGMAMPGIPVDRRARPHATLSLPIAIASRLLQLQSAWMRLLARHRLRRSIAHLDDRLLADIGLSSRISVLQNDLPAAVLPATAFWADCKTRPTSRQPAIIPLKAINVPCQMSVERVPCLSPGPSRIAKENSYPASSPAHGGRSPKKLCQPATTRSGSKSPLPIARCSIAISRRSSRAKTGRSSR